MLDRVALWLLHVERLRQELSQLRHVGLPVLRQQVVLVGVPSNIGVLPSAGGDNEDEGGGRRVALSRDD